MNKTPSLLLSLVLFSPIVAGCNSTLYTVKHEASSDLTEGRGVVYALPKKELVVSFDVTKTKTSYGQWSCLNPELGLPKIEKHDELCANTMAKIGALNEMEADDSALSPTSTCPPQDLPKPGSAEDKYEADCTTFNNLRDHEALATFLAAKPGAFIPRVAPTHKLSAQRITEQVLPDPAQIYRISLDQAEKSRSRTLKFVLSEDGRLSNSDALLVDARPEMAAAGIRTATNVVGKVVSLILGTPGAASTPSSIAEDIDALDAIIPSTRDKNKKSKLEDERDALETQLETCRKYGDACAAAERLRKLVSERDRLLPNPSASLQPSGDGELARLERLDKEIETLEKLFYPSKTKVVTTWVEAVEPTIGAAGSAIEEWCLDPATGTVAAPTANCKAKNRRKLMVDALSSLSATPGPVDTPPDEGIRYRVPQWVSVTIVDGSDSPLISELVAIPQLGKVQSLPNEVHGRHNQLVVELSPTTGMLVRLELVDERNYADVIDALGEGSANLLDAATEAQESANSADLDERKRELELLELDRQIACYETLGGPCPGGTDE